MTHKVSVIVPIYNVGEFLAPCIDSLLGQSYADLEIILVDDGSTDGSGAVVDSYTDPRIIKIHTENQGVTATRKTGWLRSSGDYCLFVDGDDMLPADAVAFFMDKLKVKEYDFISGWPKKVYPDGRLVEMPFTHLEGEFTANEYIENSLRMTGCLRALWCGIIKRSAITEKAFDIDRRLSCGDDALTLLSILSNVSTVLCTGQITYHHVQRATSITNTSLKKLDGAYFREYYKKQLSMAGDRLKPSIYPHALQKLVPIYLKQAYREGSEERKKEYEFLLEAKAACKERLPLRVRLEFTIMKSRFLSWVYRTLGWPVMSKIKNDILPRFR